MNAVQRQAIHDLLLKAAQKNSSPHAASRAHAGQRQQLALQLEPFDSIYDDEQQLCGTKRPRAPRDVFEVQSIIRQPCCGRSLPMHAPCSEDRQGRSYGPDWMDHYAQYPSTLHVAAFGHTDCSALGLLQGAFRRHCPAAVFTHLEVWPPLLLAGSSPPVLSKRFSCFTLTYATFIITTIVPAQPESGGRTNH